MRIIAVAAAVLFLPAVLPATLVFDTLIDTQGGLGNRQILTIQGKNTGNINQQYPETGCVSFGDVEGASFGASTCTGSDRAVQDSQSEVRSLSTIGSPSYQDFGVVFNANEPSGNSITLDSLVLRIWDATGNVLYTSSGLDCGPEHPGCTFARTEPGTGNSGFLFRLNDPNAAQYFGNTGNLIGLSAAVSNFSAGPESFGAGMYTRGDDDDDDDTVIPEPSTLFLLGGALAGLGLFRRRLVA